MDVGFGTHHVVNARRTHWILVRSICFNSLTCGTCLPEGSGQQPKPEVYLPTAKALCGRSRWHRERGQYMVEPYSKRKRSNPTSHVLHWATASLQIPVSSNSNKCVTFYRVGSPFNLLHCSVVSTYLRRSDCSVSCFGSTPCLLLCFRHILSTFWQPLPHLPHLLAQVLSSRAWDPHWLRCIHT